jgi:LysR family transcriptional regulator, low CO2-responsive transcriptional regulator
MFINFTLHQLQIFLTVVRNKSVSKAARDLYMTQPAVSIQLKNFQAQFDIPLTEIIGRRLYVTSFGMEVATVAEEILQKATSIEHRLLAFKGLMTGKLKLASVSTGKYIMPYFITGFVNEHSGIELSLEVDHRDRVLKCLENNEVDMALVSVLPEGIDVEEELLMPNLLYLVGPKQYQMQQPMAVQHVSDLQAIYREKGSGTRMVLEKYMSEANLSPRVKLELTSTEAVKQAVIAGLGVSVLSVFSMHFELLQGDIKILPASGFPLKSDWRLIWLKNKTLTPVAKAYLDYVRSEKQAIIQQHFSWLKEIGAAIEPNDYAG